MSVLARQVCELVERNHARTKRPISRVWDLLYTEFEYAQNVNYRRMAYVQGLTNLDLIDQEGKLVELLDLARTFLVETPALPEQKKAPLQGSLMEDRA